MNSAYSLKIEAEPELFDLITAILEVAPTSISNAWEYIVSEGSDFFTNAPNHLLDLVEGKIGNLRKVGIGNRDISIWYFYEYDGQCNMEFDPETLKRMGAYDITLCISCWEIPT